MERRDERGEGQREETVGTAVAHVLEAGGNLIADRIDLARIEIRETLSTSAVKGGMLLAGGALLALAWGLALAAIIAALIEAGVSPAWSLAAGALLTGVLGVGLILMSARRGKKGAKEARHEARVRSERRLPSPIPLCPRPAEGRGW